MIVYGVSVSYYTGKLESYLRYKGIDYHRAVPYSQAKRIADVAGVIQIPMIERPDGRFMSDTTPIIASFEEEFSGSSIMPLDPVLKFLATLIEDYADEWLWRTALHYRWSYDHDSELLSRILADELTTHRKEPRTERIRMIRTRQFTGFVQNDGVTQANRDHVESSYLTILKIMSDILVNSPFLLGNKPSIADFGLMGPMLRHFSQDPTPSEIMRDTAPIVFEWVARMWNAKGVNFTNGNNEFIDADSPDLQPFLKEIAETHLVQLKENALAFAKQHNKFAMNVQGSHYKQLPVSRYRVYCLEILRENFANLSDASQKQVREVLSFPEADIIFSADSIAESNYDIERQAPYNKSINVFENGVPE